LVSSPLLYGYRPSVQARSPSPPFSSWARPPEVARMLLPSLPSVDNPAPYFLSHIIWND
jgi:hypothetical protein